jgi:hypothetical protein
MRNFIGIIFLSIWLIVPNIGYAQPPLPHDTQGAYVLLPDVPITAPLTIQRYLIWGAAGDTIELTMTRLEGVFIPQLSLLDTESGLLAEGPSLDIGGRFAKLTYEVELSAWYFVIAASDNNTNERNYELLLTGSTDQILTLLPTAFQSSGLEATNLPRLDDLITATPSPSLTATHTPTYTLTPSPTLEATFTATFTPPLSPT